MKVSEYTFKKLKPSKPVEVKLRNAHKEEQY